MNDRTCSDCHGPLSTISPASIRCSSCQTLNKRQRAARNSTKARRICFRAHSELDADGKRYMLCHICAKRIDPARDEWRADHIRRWSEGGTDTAGNLWPICIPCDEWKAPKDTREVAKGKRAEEKHYGVKRPARPMPGSRASGWRKRMDGSVERR